MWVFAECNGDCAWIDFREMSAASSLGCECVDEPVHDSITGFSAARRAGA
jgi:hypothetical protein